MNEVFNWKAVGAILRLGFAVFGALSCIVILINCSFTKPEYSVELLSPDGKTVEQTAIVTSVHLDGNCIRVRDETNQIQRWPVDKCRIVKKEK